MLAHSSSGVPGFGFLRADGQRIQSLCPGRIDGGRTRPVWMQGIYEFEARRVTTPCYGHSHLSNVPSRGGLNIADICFFSAGCRLLLTLFALASLWYSRLRPDTPRCAKEFFISAIRQWPGHGSCILRKFRSKRRQPATVISSLNC